MAGIRSLHRLSMLEDLQMIETEKNMFSFLPENRILETRFATYDVMTEQGWGSFQIPYKVITGW